jgi:hypothetical protein
VSGGDIAFWLVVGGPLVVIIWSGTIAGALALIKFGWKNS